MYVTSKWTESLNAYGMYIFQQWDFIWIISCCFYHWQVFLHNTKLMNSVQNCSDLCIVDFIGNHNVPGEHLMQASLEETVNINTSIIPWIPILHYCTASRPCWCISFASRSPPPSLFHAILLSEIPLNMEPISPPPLPFCQCLLPSGDMLWV